MSKPTSFIRPGEGMARNEMSMSMPAPDAEVPGAVSSQNGGRETGPFRETGPVLTTIRLDELEARIQALEQAVVRCPACGWAGEMKAQSKHMEERHR